MTYKERIQSLAEEMGQKKKNDMTAIGIDTSNIKDEEMTSMFYQAAEIAVSEMGYEFKKGVGVGYEQMHKVQAHLPTKAIESYMKERGLIPAQEGGHDE